jgi:hypothetical protein
MQGRFGGGEMFDERGKNRDINGLSAKYAIAPSLLDLGA